MHSRDTKTKKKHFGRKDTLIKNQNGSVTVYCIITDWYTCRYETMNPLTTPPRKNKLNSFFPKMTIIIEVSILRHLQ